MSDDSTAIVCQSCGREPFECECPTGYLPPPSVKPQPLVEIVEYSPRRSIVPLQGTPLANCPTNLDVTTPRGKALLLRGSSPATLALDDTGTLRMDCTAYLIVPDSATDEQTGELREFARVTLFQKDGKHFRTTSAHMPFRLSALCDLYTAEEWAGGIPLIITVRKSKRGTMYHDIQIDVEKLA